MKVQIIPYLNDVKFKKKKTIPVALILFIVFYNIMMALFIYTNDFIKLSIINI